MSRNSEKAQSLLSRYYSQQSGLNEDRPRNVAKATNLSDAEKFRNQCLKDISMKVSRIHDVLISDFQIRDLNDELNKLMREKYAWDRRVKELGGPDYLSRPQAQGDNNVARDRKGYRYFGRAKELPDVKKLLESQKQQASDSRNRRMQKYNEINEMKSMLELSNRLPPHYFGENEDSGDALHPVYPTEDDIVDEFRTILGQEFLPDNLMTSGMLEKKNEDYYNQSKESGSVGAALTKYERRTTRKLAKSSDLVDQGGSVMFDEFAAISQKEVEAFLVNKRKQELLNRLKNKV